MKTVVQKHGMGCGVACVACVLNLSYKEALKLFRRPENAWTNGYQCRELVAALNEGGANYVHKYLKDKRDLVLNRPGTIVFTRFSKAYPRGHYLVRTETGWMNPWVNFPVIAPARAALVPELPAEPIYAIYRRTC